MHRPMTWPGEGQYGLRSQCRGHKAARVPSQAPGCEHFFLAAMLCRNDRVSVPVTGNAVAYLYTLNMLNVEYPIKYAPLTGVQHFKCSSPAVRQAEKPQRRGSSPFEAEPWPRVPRSREVP